MWVWKGGGTKGFGRAGAIWEGGEMSRGGYVGVTSSLTGFSSCQTIMLIVVKIFKKNTKCEFENQKETGNVSEVGYCVQDGTYVSPHNFQKVSRCITGGGRGVGRVPEKRQKVSRCITGGARG